MIMAKEDWSYGGDAETGNGMDRKKSEAILRVTYLLAASDGDVRRDEREVFKQTLAALEGFKMGDAETTKFIEDVVEDARKLAFLRDFYSEDEMVKAFLSKAAEDLTTLYGDKVAVRKAFAAWLSICLADKEYSAFERRLVKEMQVALNMIGKAGIAMPLIGGLLGGAVGLLAATVVGGSAKKKAEKQSFGADAYVSDAFLAEVEDRLVAIDEMQGKLAKCKGKSQKRSLEESLSYLVESLKSFLANVDE